MEREGNRKGREQWREQVTYMGGNSRDWLLWIRGGNITRANKWYLVKSYPLIFTSLWKSP